MKTKSARWTRLPIKKACMAKPSLARLSRLVNTLIHTLAHSRQGKVFFYNFVPQSVQHRRDDVDTHGQQVCIAAATGGEQTAALRLLFAHCALAVAFQQQHGISQFR